MPTVKGVGVYRPISEISKDIKKLAEELEAATQAQESQSSDCDSEESSSDE